MNNELAMMRLSEVGELLDTGQVSPVDLVWAVAGQIESRQSEINAFITPLIDEALALAKRAEAEIAENGRKSPLDGIPVALKDLFFTAGVRTTAGSKVLSQFVPEEDGTVARKLKEAGSLLIGKTNTHEFAFGPTNESSYFGPTRNPWDSRLISGGSSGGSGAAVATGMAYMAMGTDTGGSIRIPACLVGVVGFKPSYGLVSLNGIVPLSYSCDHPGPLARSVMDIALTMDIIAGLDDERMPKVSGFARALSVPGDKPLAGMLIGVPANFFFDKVEPEIEHLVREAIHRMEAAGAVTEEVFIPRIDEVFAVTSTVMSWEAAQYHRHYLEQRPDDYQPDVKTRLEKALNITDAEYHDAMRLMAEIRREMDQVYSRVALLATPTLPVVAYPIGQTSIMVRGNMEPARDTLVRHTRLANLTGGPAISVPCGLTAQRLPCGIQIMGKPLDDLTVLRAAHVCEMLMKA